MTSRAFLPRTPRWVIERSVSKKETMKPKQASAQADLFDYGRSPLRFCIPDAATMLQMSRAQLYNRIREGSIRAQKDGNRTYITRGELERYVAWCEDLSSSESTQAVGHVGLKTEG
jgi:hypothetical protein